MGVSSILNLLHELNKIILCEPLSLWNFKTSTYFNFIQSRNVMLKLYTLKEATIWIYSIIKKLAGFIFSLRKWNWSFKEYDYILYIDIWDSENENDAIMGYMAIWYNYLDSENENKKIGNML
jgi:hypothetical protein